MELKALENKIDELSNKIDEQFKKVDERFEKIDERFEKIDERFGKMDERFENLKDELTGEIRARFFCFEQEYGKKIDAVHDVVVLNKQTTDIEIAKLNEEIQKNDARIRRDYIEIDKLKESKEINSKTNSKKSKTINSKRSSKK